ncbi:hypothetical protein LTR36_006685 [Oleoguttula mirabilis]|uniref:Uncharacterized protein n=1 Tax=Oleoguttula mirabilis TaxID=1507867 RepID=A0AAV9JC72_9PEZI|nr:hypothetical protein LTR36_006685 [Oleoguttula mirabilis]
MFSTKILYSGAALYATTTAFAAVWISLALPIQHKTVGPDASEMGFAVAKALASRGGLHLYLLDLSPPLEDVENATFHHTNPATTGAPTEKISEAVLMLVDSHDDGGTPLDRPADGIDGVTGNGMTKALREGCGAIGQEALLRGQQA